jgi:hypothetical protein
MASQTGGYGNVTVATTATLIKAAASRQSISIYNNGASTVFVGYDTAVTTTNGMPIPAGAEREIRDELAVYGIVASGTVDVRYIEERMS